MSIYSFSHLSDRTLVQDLAEAVARDRASTAMTVALIAEFDSRRLYLPAGYPSMFAYCVGELHFSESAAYRRIHAARAARRFPNIFSALATGRLHLSAVVTLAPRLTPEHAEELLVAAAHKTKAELELLLAERFPDPDMPTRIVAISLPSSSPHEPEPTDHIGPATDLGGGSLGDRLLQDSVQSHETKLAPERVSFGTSEPAGATAAAQRHPRPIVPLAPQRFAIQFTVGQGTHDKLRFAQDLVSHEVPTGDIGDVIDLALDALIASRMKRKFAAADKPRTPRQHSAAEGRYVPAHVRRAVWERDGGQCTFVSETGHRCPARRFLELDHIEPVARGGRATVDNTRLRCRAHNQYEAEQILGAEFMRQKREQARDGRRSASA
jgi:hypothetical protein